MHFVPFVTTRIYITHVDTQILTGTDRHFDHLFDAALLTTQLAATPVMQFFVAYILKATGESSMLIC
jgi:hypothetical protein